VRGRTRHLGDTTDAADAIEANGFRDGSGGYGFAQSTLTGVFLSVRPANVSDGGSGETVLEVVIGDEVELAKYAIEEVGHAVWEYCVPAALLNLHATARRPTEAELHEVIESRPLSWRAERPLPTLDFPPGRLLGRATTQKPDSSPTPGHPAARAPLPPPGVRGLHR
jgi:hypothetical protein